MTDSHNEQRRRFEAWWTDYLQSGLQSEVALGITRAELRQMFGEPDTVSVPKRRRPLEGIWLFGIVEFHFDRHGKLFLVFSEQPDLIPRVILPEKWDGPLEPAC